ncbi:MAG: hypothetical protein K9G60_00180 [Pseudolabrys sp.]|nr:hypothetical protein [Pseudolabrys sp.]
MSTNLGYDRAYHLNRYLDATPIASFTFMVILILASLSISGGLIPNDTLSLWSGAIIAGNGQQSIGRIVAAYPTLPFMATAALESLLPVGSPVPALLAAALVGLLAGLWFMAFRTAKLNFGIASLTTILLAFHPAVLRAALAGPAEMLIALFLYLLGNALFDLRERGAAPEVMIVSLALLGLTFSHPMGAAIACAAVPFLVFAVRPVLVANSAFNVVLALVFPTVFSVGAFTYVSWIFPGDGWSFYSAPAESLSAWAAGVSSTFGGGFTGIHAIDAALAFSCAIVLGAPLAVIATRQVYRRRPHFAPPTVLAASAITAAAISVATGLFGDPAAVAVVAPVLCAIVIIRLPNVREHTGHMVSLLIIGWLGGALALALVDPRAATQLTGLELNASRERIDALDLGHASVGKDGLLIDTDNTPAVVIGRADARGLLTPASEKFALTILLSRLDAPFIATPNPQSNTGARDRLALTFPLLYRKGAPGYRLIYQNDTWRLFARN